MLTELRPVGTLRAQHEHVFCIFLRLRITRHHSLLRVRGRLRVAVLLVDGRHAWSTGVHLLVSSEAADEHAVTLDRRHDSVVLAAWHGDSHLTVRPSLTQRSSHLHVAVVAGRIHFVVGVVQDSVAVLLTARVHDQVTHLFHVPGGVSRIHGILATLTHPHAATRVECSLEAYWRRAQSVVAAESCTRSASSDLSAHKLKL